MKWILENFQVVIAVVAALAYYLTRAARSEPESERRPNAPASAAQHEQAERTRRIQEEIRRKIAERRPAAGDVITAEPAPETAPPLLESAPGVPPVDPFGGPGGRLRRELKKAAERRRAPVADEPRERANEVERQMRLAEQLRALQARREAEERRAEEIVAATARAATRQLVARAAQLGAPRDWQSRLRNRDELRRAVILREILGPPVGLR